MQYKPGVARLSTLLSSTIAPGAHDACYSLPLQSILSIIH